ncbi:MAG: ChaN family lipoprotein [Gammaproteobacteria bacterium]
MAAAIVVLAGCASGHTAFHGAHSMAGHAAKAADSGQPAAEVPVLDLRHLSALKDVLPALADRRVVYVGETHDRYAHHLTQLEIVKAMHAANPRLAIGMEMFQQPFQSYLNDYLAGVLGEREMLVATEYFRRWRYDYRLYAPILRYARDNGLPVVALNVAGDLVEQVRAHGIDGLDAADRARVPAEIERGNAEYEARLRAIFDQHPHTKGRGFERFLDGQLLWDEGMAERAARYLKEHPEDAMVVLAGSGHLAYGDGIPDRLARRVPVAGAIVLNGWEGEITPEVADYLLMPAERTLPAAGRIGALLVPDGDGLKVEACTADSACAAAGIERGDRLLAIDAVPVSDLADVNAVMWDRKPEEAVTLTLRRERWFAPAEERTVELKLR